MKSFECPSPMELDRKFFGEQSLLSASSLELSTSRVSNDTMADGSDPRLSILASLCMSSGSISPCQALNHAQETDNCYLAVPLQGKSSTPHLKQAAVFDQSYSDLTASRMSWDVSGIKSENNSPRPGMESSALEATWSPKIQTQHSGAEVSP
ncbi:hypothetical protein PBY51_013698 [Eleginops maclovinus]|uniref:Uncharacterized protein n=1 Tax=Eleginops maclovinus TaxID=56733 RepID=A0AAN8AY06_ELEMC|nr:hypothetical protein PBY51_013698 [Eleginops maclovinus]